MNEIIIFEEIKKDIKTNEIHKYMLKGGVWSLYGRRLDGDEWECLNVAKHVNVGKEMLYDLGCLKFVPYMENGDRQYFNHLKEYCGFNYKKNQVQEYLYPYIAKEYIDFKIVYVHDKADFEVEKEYAKKKNARFWRHGRPFCEENK